MNILDLFRLLSYGELSNTSIGVDGSGTIDEKHYGKIVSYANEALLRLYSRFALRECDVIVEMVEHITNYHLSSKFAETQYNPVDTRYPYIKDLPNEPFNNDVIKILSVYASDGTKLPLNDVECSASVFTPQANVLQVPEPQAGVALSVHYQARHPELHADRLSDQIYLPDVLVGALTAFIAYKTYSHMNTQESTAKGQEHLATYEFVVSSVAESDTASTSVSSTNTRFTLRGWI